MNQKGEPAGSTRAAIVAVASQVFAERGFRGASVREITTRAGVNLGAITYHFGSKAALFEAVLTRHQTELIARLEAAARRPGSTLERLEAVVRTHFLHLAGHPEVRRLLMQVLLAPGDLPRAAGENVRRMLGIVADLIARGQAEGVFRPGDPRMLTLAVMAQPLMLNVLRGPLRAGPHLDLEQPRVRTRVLENALQFIRAGLLTPATREV
jgi:AcrR family transcriptional regulator